jgi:glycosyltransferase involved in cell wall biosynthesis
MNENIKLSVTVVTYNQPDFLIEAIESILSQIVNFKYEIVVGDDASTDNNLEILNSYQLKYPGIFSLVTHTHNVGPYQNFHDTLLVCKGEYIAHLDGDDRMLPGRLQKQMDFLEAHPECAMVGHNLRLFEHYSGKDMGLFSDKPIPEITTDKDLLIKGTYFGHSSKMYRKSSIPPEGFDINAGDWLFHLTNAQYGEVGYIDEVLGEYRKHPGGISVGIANMQKQLNIQLYTLGKMNSLGKYSTDLMNLAYARVYYSFAWDSLLKKSYQPFQEAIVKSYENKIKISGMQKWLILFRRYPGILVHLVRFKIYLSGLINKFR